MPMATASPWEILKIGKLLQFVRGPMAKIERTRGAHLKRVAAGGNVIEVQFGAAADQPLHCRRLKGHEFFGIAFQFVKKFCVADAGDFHGLDIAGAFVARFKRGEQIEIVDDGERRREGADEIFLPKALMPFFTPTPESAWDRVVVGMRT